MLQDFLSKLDMPILQVTWETPHADALHVVNVMDSNGQLPDFPQTVSGQEVSQLLQCGG